MKIREQIAKWQTELKNCQNLVAQTNSNAERFYLEVRGLKDSVARLVAVNAEMAECILALLKQQLGD